MITHTHAHTHRYVFLQFQDAHTSNKAEKDPLVTVGVPKSSLFRLNRTHRLKHVIREVLENVTSKRFPAHQDLGGIGKLEGLRWPGNFLRCDSSPSAQMLVMHLCFPWLCW